MYVPPSRPHGARFQVRFRPACLHDRCASFPCDERGVVYIDRLTETGRPDFVRIMWRLEHTQPKLVSRP